MTCSNPSVSKKLPSSEAPTLPQASPAKKSALRVSRVPAWVRNSNVRRFGRVVEGQRRRHVVEVHREQRRRDVHGDALRQPLDRRRRTPQVDLDAGHEQRPEEPETLEVIEVQTGDYLGEDDIERFEDEYGRSPATDRIVAK